MPALAVLVFACVTSYALAVDLQMYPTAEEMPPVITPGEVDHANAVLATLGLTSWFACPLVGRMTNKMVTLPDGYTYHHNRVVASRRNTDTLMSPHYQHLTIPTRLAFAFLNLDLMDVAKNAESLVQSITHGEIPATIHRWIGSPLRQPIWICADGRSRIMTSFQRPFTIEQLGMLLVLDNEEFCFRNIRLEQVVDEICRLVNCGTGDVPHIRETSVILGTAHVEPGAHRLLSVSSLLSPSTAEFSSRPSVPSQRRRTIGTSSSETSTAIRSLTRTATSSSGSSLLSNHQYPDTLVSPVGTDDADSIDWTDTADSIPWPSASEVKLAPSLPSEMSSAWAATIAHTRALDEFSFWDRGHLCSSRKDNFYAALFWERHYRSTLPADVELPLRPSNPDGMRGWQASCHRFFQAAEDAVVNAILKKEGNRGSVCRHSMCLQAKAETLGLVHVPSPGSKRKRAHEWSDIADAIPWPSASEVKPAPSLPCDVSSAWAATISYTRALDKISFWDRSHHSASARVNFYAARFWALQYCTTRKPTGMELPPKPKDDGDIRGWQADCHRFFQAAEDMIVDAILKKRGNRGPICRHSLRLQEMAKNIGLIEESQPCSTRQGMIQNVDAFGLRGTLYQ